MTETAKELWSNVAFIEKQYESCLDYTRKLISRYQNGEISTRRFEEIFPSAIYQGTVFRIRREELKMLM